MVEARGHAIPGLRMLRIPVRPAWLGVIFLGGAVGTAIRAWLETTYAAPAGQLPWVTLLINVSGALVLGVLVDVLAESGPDKGVRRGLRLGVGTGVLGGYTTYSTFSVESFQLWNSSTWALGLIYALLSVVAGLAAAYFGALTARRVLRRYRRYRQDHG
ncbi:MAG: CrcB family protein [Propionibacteriaceae bacterium]